MTSSDEMDAWQPEPPELLSPWHTPDREALQLQARRFAMEEVLPVGLTTIFEGTSVTQERIISDRLLPRSPLT